MPVGVDIFSGAGGLSLGAEMAGIEVRFAVERDESAAETYRYNHPDTTMLCDDIHNINPLEHLNENDDVFIVFGGPPCQAFSMLNRHNASIADDKRCLLYLQYGKFLAKYKPMGFVFENVLGLLSSKKNHFENIRIKNI